MNNYYVLIVKYENGEIVKEMGPMDERKANKVEDGVNINLNHEEYYTDIMKKESDD